MNIIKKRLIRIASKDFPDATKVIRKAAKEAVKEVMEITYDSYFIEGTIDKKTCDKILKTKKIPLAESIVTSSIQKLNSEYESIKQKYTSLSDEEKEALTKQNVANDLGCKSCADLFDSNCNEFFSEKIGTSTLGEVFLTVYEGDFEKILDEVSEYLNYDLDLNIKTSSYYNSLTKYRSYW